MRSVPEDAPRSRHPRLVAAPLAAFSIAALAAALGAAGVAEGAAARVLAVALPVGVLVAIPTAATGLRDLARLRPRTRAGRLAAVHGGIMFGAIAMMIAATAMTWGAMDDGDVRPIHAALTLGGVAILLTGAAIGAAARHLYGAGLREETIRDGAPAGAGGWEPAP